MTTTTIPARFERFIANCAAHLEVALPSAGGDRRLFLFQDRYLELKYRARFDAVLFSSVVHVQEAAAEAISAEAIAAYNIQALFRGGATLLLQPSSRSIYICRHERLGFLLSGEADSLAFDFWVEAQGAQTWLVSQLL